MGLVFGFVAFLLFTGIQFAGEIIDIQIGFAVVNVINPLTSQSVTVIGEFQLALATLLYLAADAHHALIAGIAGSFQLVPLPFAGAPELVAGDVMRFFGQSLFIVFEIAAPVAVALFLVNVMLGADGARRAADERVRGRLSDPDHGRAHHADRLAAAAGRGVPRAGRHLDAPARHDPARDGRAQRPRPRRYRARRPNDGPSRRHRKGNTETKREARQRGQVARSHDIGGSAIFLAIVIALHVGFLAAIDAGAQAFTVALTHAGSHEELTIRSIGGLFLRSIMPYSPLLAMAFGAGVVLAVVANVLQFGLLFSPQLVVPKFSKLNPAAGFKRIFFSPQTLVQLAKQLLKLAIVC